MTVFSGRESVEQFLAEFDGWLSKAVSVSLVGGSAMTVHGLKDQTEDIDLALGVRTEFEHVRQSLRAVGFEVVEEPTAEFDHVGKTLELHHDERGFRVDLFERQIVGKVWITETMRERADEFWTGERVSASVLADEDMFLLKAVSAGDLGAGRRRDLEDMRTYAQRGLDYEMILAEIEHQRPFNEGVTEARQIRDRSHPLFTIETAVQSLSGLPSEFTARVSDLATEFETEYFVLMAVDDGVNDVEQIRERVHSNVRSLPETDEDAVEAAVDRLVDKEIAVREGQTVRLD